MQLDLPTIQNWNCHSCSGCCHQHGIYITDEEKERIEKQNWPADGSIPADQPLFVKMGSAIEKKWWRLAHQPNGACVFLDDKGLCRIHGKFGEDAKPLACRIYPYAFHPAGKKVVVSLRFSCPSVVANRGQPVQAQSKEIREIARQVVPDNYKDAPPPRITTSTSVDWPDVLRFARHLDETMADESVPVVVRLIRAGLWLRLVEQAKFDKVTGERLEEFLELIRGAAEGDVPRTIADLAEVTPEPSRAGRAPFRLLAGHYARKDTYSHPRGFGARWDLLKRTLRLARGKGDVPSIQECFKEVPFERLEAPMGLPESTDEIFTRYFRVKIQGLAFCGRAYYDVPLVEGFDSLSLVYPSVLWLSRWLAVSNGRDALTTEDISGALAIADHHHGYSPAFGTRSFRQRVKTLSQLGDVARLGVWYSR